MGIRTTSKPIIDKMGMTSDPRPKRPAKKTESYDIVDHSEFDVNTFMPKTVKSILVAEDDVLYRKDNITADAGLRVELLKYNEVDDRNIQAVVKALKEIEGKFEYRVYLDTQVTLDNFKLWCMLGDLTSQRQIWFNEARDIDRILMSSFDMFKELLKANLEKIGEMKKFERRPEDKDWNNKVLKDSKYCVETKAVYQQQGLGSFMQTGIVANPYRTQQPPVLEPVKIQSKGIVREMQKPKKEKIIEKPKRKYDLDSIKVSDEIYEEVVKWIDDLKDFLYVDYDLTTKDKKIQKTRKGSGDTGPR